MHETFDAFLEKSPGDVTILSNRAKVLACLLTSRHEAEITRPKYYADGTKFFSSAAEFLQVPVKALLESDPDHYHNSLQALLSATGSTQKITPK